MRSFVIVVPHKAGDRAAAGAECKQPVDVEAFVVDGPEKTLDLAVGLRGIGTHQVMSNVEGAADLLESCEAVGVVRVAHGEREGVIGPHGLDRVRQRRHQVLQEDGRRGAGLVGLNPDNRLSAEVIDGRELEVMPRGTREPIQPMVLEDALHGAVARLQHVGNAHRTRALRAQGENPPHGFRAQLRRRRMWTTA